MVQARSLAIQSILYRSASSEVRRSAEAVAASAVLARREGFLGDWVYLLGDCSEDPVLDEGDRHAIGSIVTAAGGRFGYLHFGANLGHGGGHNRLATEAETEVLMFLNPDALVAPETVVRLLEVLTDNVGVVDGRQLPLEHPKDFDAVTGDTSWSSGACMMTPRAVFDRAHGFDDGTFFLYCDDVDYSWRVRLAGLRAVHAPSARVFHDKRLAPSGDLVASDAEHYYSAEAGLLLAHKYSRPDLVARILTAFDSPGASDFVRRAAAEFRARTAARTLPEPLDPEGTVAQFIAGNYAVHRY